MSNSLEIRHSDEYTNLTQYQNLIMSVRVHGRLMQARACGAAAPGLLSEGAPKSVNSNIENLDRTT